MLEKAITAALFVVVFMLLVKLENDIPIYLIKKGSRVPKKFKFYHQIAYDICKPYFSNEYIVNSLGDICNYLHGLKKRSDYYMKNRTEFYNDMLDNAHDYNGARLWALIFLRIYVVDRSYSVRQFGRPGYPDYDAYTSFVSYLDREIRKYQKANDLPNSFFEVLYESIPNFDMNSDNEYEIEYPTDISEIKSKAEELNLILNSILDRRKCVEELVDLFAKEHSIAFSINEKERIISDVYTLLILDDPNKYEGTPDFDPDAFYITDEVCVERFLAAAFAYNISGAYKLEKQYDIPADHIQSFKHDIYKSYMDGVRFSENESAFEAIKNKYFLSTDERRT